MLWCRYSLQDRNRSADQLPCYRRRGTDNYPDDETINEGHTTRLDGSPYLSTPGDALAFAEELETTATWMRLLAAESFVPFEFEGIGMRTSREFASLDELKSFLAGLGGPIGDVKFPAARFSCDIEGEHIGGYVGIG